MNYVHKHRLCEMYGLSECVKGLARGESVPEPDLVFVVDDMFIGSCLIILLRLGSPYSQVLLCIIC